MIRRLIVAAAGLAILSSGHTQAASPPATLVGIVKARVEAEATEGMTPEEIADPSVLPPAYRQAPAAMFRKVDLDGDGRPDWRVDYEKAPNPSFFCGTGGCRTELYLALPDGSFRLVFGATVRDFRLSGPARARVLDIDFHGSACGGYGVDPCPRRYGWDGAAFVERPNARGQSLLNYGAVPAVPPAPETLPEGVLAELSRRAEVCKAAGGGYSPEGAVTGIPDIDGDGRRDWVVGTWDSCDFSEEEPAERPDLPVTVLVTAGDPAASVRAYESADLAWAVDIAGAPARFFRLEQQEGCEVHPGPDRKVCARTPLTWDPASRTLR